MYRFAVKLLFKDKKKFLTFLFGLTFITFIIIQQMALLLGLMGRTYGFISDTHQPNIWVMDKNTKSVEEIIPMQINNLYKVRSIPGVEWAVPLYKGKNRIRFKSGDEKMCHLIGIDDSTLIGAPPKMRKGQVKDLRKPDAIFLDQPLGNIGERVEINDHRAIIEGFCHISKPLHEIPTIYTSFKRALEFSPPERELLSFVLVKAKPHESLQALCNRIKAQTGLAAYTSPKLKQQTLDYYFRHLSLFPSFSFVLLLGLLLSLFVAGSMVSQFMCSSWKRWGVFSHQRSLWKVRYFQALLISFFAGGIAIGLASLPMFFPHKEMAYKMTGSLYFGSLALLLCVVFFATFFKRVFTTTFY